MCVWDLGTGRQEWQLLCDEVEETSGPPAVTALCLDDSDRRVLVGWSQGAVHVYSVQGGPLQHALASESSAAVVAVSPAQHLTGRSDWRPLLMAAFADGCVALWPARPEERACRPVRWFEPAEWAPSSKPEAALVAVARLGPQRFLGGQRNGYVTTWDAQTGFVMRRGEAVPASVRCTELPPAPAPEIPVTAAWAVPGAGGRAAVCVVGDGAGRLHLVDAAGMRVLVSMDAQRRIRREAPLPPPAVTALDGDVTAGYLFVGDSSGHVQVGASCAKRRGGSEHVKVAHTQRCGPGSTQAAASPT